MDEKWVVVVLLVAVALAASVLVVGAYAFWVQMWWAPDSGWGAPMGPMMGRTMGPMMGSWSCMQWMWGSGSQPQQQPAPPRNPDVELTVYAGDYRFGLRPDAMTSPGPELRVKVGSLVKLTVVNVGQAVHVLTVVRDLREDPDAVPVFEGASAGTPRNPIPPGSSVTVYFVADRVGSYYYVCNVPGHVSLGMYGRFVVESA